MAATLTPPGITNTAGTLALSTNRAAVLDPSGVTGDDGQLLHRQLTRTAAYSWVVSSTWQLPGRTFNYIDIGTLGMSIALPPRTYAPAWLGGSIARTTGQIWPV